jgi:hypothetical protein
MGHSRNHTIIRCLISCIVLLICLSVWRGVVWPLEGKKAAEEIINKWQDAVITVKVVIKVRFVVEGRETDETEDVMETIATMIDPSGLAVLSYSSVDPVRILDDYFKQLQNLPNVHIESDLTDVKMFLSDGREIPAKIVMRDNELDLLFIRSVNAIDGPVHALELSKNADELSIMDEVLILTRLGSMTGRIPSVSLYRIEAIVKKPRIFYVIDENALSGRLGAPVFSLKGKFLGVLVLISKKTEYKKIGMSELFGGASRTGILPGILPAEEIAAVAKQVRTLKEEDGDEKEIKK